MCGIIGYLGDREATPILMESLKRLEYRGYDSAGVAVLEGAGRSARRTSVTKSETKVDVLIEKLQANMPTGKLGIGHTRWATHGKPTYINAHPHTDCHQRIYVVHNGIIENFAELKSELQAKGHEFTSDTDTEVVPHLIEANYKGDFLAAVRAALKRWRCFPRTIRSCSWARGSTRRWSSGLARASTTSPQISRPSSRTRSACLFSVRARSRRSRRWVHRCTRSTVTA